VVTRVRATAPEVALARILQALEAELIAAPNEEILEAARDLGMNLQRKDSAAFRGLTYPSTWQLSDFFEFEMCKTLGDFLRHDGYRRAEIPEEPHPRPARTRPQRKTRRPKRPI
jgi:hypothetical protein